MGNQEKSKEILKELYKEDFKIKTEDGKPFPIPEKGSLGLLALGYKGIIAWRKVRKQQNLIEKTD